MRGALWSQETQETICAFQRNNYYCCFSSSKAYLSLQWDWLKRKYSVESRVYIVSLYWSLEIYWESTELHQGGTFHLTTSSYNIVSQYK